MDNRILMIQAVNFLNNAPGGCCHSLATALTNLIEDPSSQALSDALVDALNRQRSLQQRGLL